MPTFPNQFAIINDPAFGNSTVDADTNTNIIKSKKVGPTLANQSNKGDANLFLTGTPTENIKYEFRCQDGGGTGKGTVAWKKKEESNDLWKGYNDERNVTHISNPFNDTTDVLKSTSYIYVPLNNREIIYAQTRTRKDRLIIKYRSYSPTNDSGSDETWTETSLLFNDFGSQDLGVYNNTDRPNRQSFDVCILENGDILLATINNNDIDIYRSTDGITFTLAINGLFSDITTSGQRTSIYNIELKSSGNYVSIVCTLQLSYILLTSEVFFRSFFSADGGSSWTVREGSLTDSLKIPFSMTGIPYEYEEGEIWTHGAIDDEGTFFLINGVDGEESSLVVGVSRGGSPFEIVNGFEFTGDYTSKPVISKCSDSIYIFLYSLAQIPRKLLASDPFEIQRKNFELFRAKIDRSAYVLGNDVSFVRWSSTSGSAFYFIRDLSAVELPNSSICINGIVSDRYNDRMNGISYFRLGGWDTYAIRPFNYNNSTNRSYITSTSFGNANNTSLTNNVYLFDINWTANYGIPSSTADSNGFLGGGEDPSLFDSAQEISFVGWERSYMQIIDGANTVTGNTKTGLLFRHISQPCNANGIDSAIVKASSAVTNFHSEFIYETIGYDDGYKLDADSPVSNYAFIPYIKPEISQPTSSSNQEHKDYDDLVRTHPHGGCLNFICKASDGNNVPVNGEDSTIVAGLCTYLGTRYIDPDLATAGQTRILNLRIGIGKNTIDLMDCNRYDSSGVQQPIRIRRITLTDTNDLQNNYYEVRLGIHPTKEDSLDPKIFMMCRKMNSHTWIKDDGGTFASTGLDTNDTTKFYVGQHPNHNDPVLNQIVYFGHVTGTTATFLHTVESNWKQFAFYSGNDLNTLSYSGRGLSPVVNLETFDRLPGKQTSSFPIPINDNISAIFGGSGLVIGDLYESDIDHDYSPQNITSYNSPRIPFETNSMTASTGNTISLIFSTINDESMYLDAVSSFNSRVKNVKFNYSLDGTTYNTVAGTSDDYLNFDTNLTGSVQEINHNVISVRWSSTSYNKIRNGIFNSSDKQKYVFYKGASPTATGTTWENSGIAYDIERTIQKGQITRSDGITANESDIIISTKTASSYFPIAGTTNASFVVGSTFNIYSSRAYSTNMSSYAKVCKKMRIDIEGFEYGDSNFARIGSLIAGTTFTFNPLLDWEFKDTEEPNQEFNETRSGLNWVYNKGPSVRTLGMSLNGDVDQQMRYEFRNILNSVTKYARSPISLIIGSGELQSNQGELYEDLILTRFSDSTDFQNAGWKYDEVSSNWKPVGSMSLKFTEIV
jgi:hypothetical protein